MNHCIGLTTVAFIGGLLVYSMAGANVAVPQTQNQLDAEFQRAVPQKKQAMRQLRQKLILAARGDANSPADLAATKANFALLNDQGRFTDLLKTGTPRRWSEGLARLRKMAPNFARMTPQEQTPLRDRLFAAIQYYCRDVVEHPDPFTGAAFTAPRAASTIYFSLYDQLQASQFKDVADALKQTLFLTWYYPLMGENAAARKTHPYRIAVFTGPTGQFTVGNLAYRSLIQCAVAMDDTKLLDTARTVMVRSLDYYTSYQTPDPSFWDTMGMTYDGNGFAHGRQSYLFGYVQHWVNGLLHASKMFEGTPWAIPTDKWDNVAAMLLDGTQWYVYQSDVDWSVNGRHNMYPGLIGNGSQNGAKMLEDAAAGVLAASEGQVQRADELRAMMKRLAQNEEFAGCRYFWNAEDLILRGKDFYIGVNLSSIRSQGPESASPSSVVNYYFPFGSMMIKTKGDEYRRARGAIRYDQLPGITSDPTIPLNTGTSWRGYHSINTFCGGVSDGNIGVAGMIFQHKSMPTTGHKGYFASERGMVGLGADLTTGKVQTIVNQTEWRGDVSYGTGDQAGRILHDTAAVDIPLGKGAWVYQDGTGYLLLPSNMNATAKLTLEKRKTHWANLAHANKTNPDAQQTVEPIFQLTIDQSDDHDTYAYAVLPHAAPEVISQYVKAPPFEVLANSKQAQAVRWNDSGVIQVIFYEAGRVAGGHASIAVDRPAVLMLKPHNDGWDLYVSDPIQRTPAGQVQVTMTLPTADAGTKDLVLHCDLPDKPLIGKAAMLHLSKAGLASPPRP